MNKYPTDLSDAEWERLDPLLTAPRTSSGRPKTHSPRAILDAIFFYVLPSGCPWRLLPRNFLPWKSTVYHYFRQWPINGSTCERLNSRRCASVSGPDWAGGMRTPAPRSWTRSRRPRRPPRWAGSKGVTTVGGKKVCGRKRATCWWTPRVSYSRRRFTAQRCPTRTG